jgi:Flp pilus assembly protein TadD
VEHLAAEGASAFKAARFEDAAQYYREAEQVATHPEERAALEMNLGACLSELGRLEEAKQAFLRAAELLPAVAPKARLQAGMLAVELGQIDEAEKLLAAARPVDDSLLPRAEDLKERIDGKRSAVRRAEFAFQVEAATKAIEQRDWTAAETVLREAEARFDVASERERVDVLHGLAMTELALHRPEDAQQAIASALAISPEDPELYYVQGRTFEALDQRTDARAAYRRALELRLPPPLADSARSSIEALDPLSPSEFYGWLTVAAGYDTNPRQTGEVTETALGSRGRGGTGYGRFAAELGRVQRVHEQFTLGLRYAGEWIGMQKPVVRELSLQNHGGYLGAQWVPSDRLVLGLELGPSVTYLGVSDISLYTWDFLGGANARYRASAVRTWRAKLEVRRVVGATDWEFLGGTRLDAELSHTWRYQSFDFRLGLRGRGLWIGTRTTAVDSTVIPACAGVCDGATYEIPLSYLGVGPLAAVRLSLHSRLRLDVFSQLDLRQYQDESYIAGVDASRKRRFDSRYHLGVDLRWALDEDEHFVIVPSYALLVSNSNIAQSSTASEHLYDYDDRSFTQHFAELGLEVSY